MGRDKEGSKEGRLWGEKGSKKGRLCGEKDSKEGRLCGEDDSLLGKEKSGRRVEMGEDGCEKQVHVGVEDSGRRVEVGEEGSNIPLLLRFSEVQLLQMLLVSSLLVENVFPMGSHVLLNTAHAAIAAIKLEAICDGHTTHDARLHVYNSYQKMTLSPQQ